MPYNRARLELGPERAEALWRLTERALDRIEHLAGDAFVRSGSLRLAAAEREREELTREFEVLRDDGFSVTWAAELPAPLDRLYLGGLVHPRDGALQPARWVRRLAKHALEAGAEIAERSPIELGTVDGSPLVIAVDAPAAGLVPELAHAVLPVRGQVLVTEPLPQRTYERPHYARDGFDYWQQLPDGRLLAGGKRDASFETEQTDIEATTPLVQGLLEELVRELLGRVPRITHRWAGIWGETPDGLPLAGRIPGRPGAWIAGGYSGHGNVLGFACGDLVARAILGDETPEFALFDPARFAGGDAAWTGRT